MQCSIAKRVQINTIFIYKGIYLLYWEMDHPSLTKQLKVYPKM